MKHVVLMNRPGMRLDLIEAKTYHLIFAHYNTAHLMLVMAGFKRYILCEIKESSLHSLPT